MPRGFPLQDEGPGMKQMFHDLAVEQEEAKAAKADATFYAGDAMRREARHDHKYEPGAYGVCRRCGEERH